MKAMILAAGFGTRMRPVTYTLPKPMMPVCNRPLIGYAVERFLAAGVHDIIVNLHHLPATLEAFLRERYGSRANLEFSHETEILGTGGALRKVRASLEKEEDFFLVNGDTIQFPRWDALREARKSQQALAALTLRRPPQGDKFTAVWFDEGRITGFGKGMGEALMFSGSHVISSRIFKYLPEKEFSGIVDEVYQPVLDDRRETIGAIVDDGLWFDIGKPQRYMGAFRGIREATIAGEVELAEGSRIDGDSIVDATALTPGTIVRSTVGARSEVKGEVRDSAIWDDCRIAGAALLERCIVAHGVVIDGPMELHDKLICRDDPAIPRDAGYEFVNGLAIAAI